MVTYASGVCATHDALSVTMHARCTKGLDPLDACVFSQACSQPTIPTYSLARVCGTFFLLRHSGTPLPTTGNYAG